MLVTVLLFARAMGWVFEALRLVPSCLLPWLGQNLGVIIRVCVEPGVEWEPWWLEPRAADEGGGSGLEGVGKDFPVCLPRYELRYREERAQEQGLEAGEGLMPVEDFVPVEELVPEEQLGAIEEAVPAEERVTEEAELVSEEAEAWEDLELEVDEATQMNVVTSALEASGLGPSCLDIKYVLQQLANWQDAHFRRQLRQKMLQKGECSRGGLPLASLTSCRSSS